MQHNMVVLCLLLACCTLWYRTQALVFLGEQGWLPTELLLRLRLDHLIPKPPETRISLEGRPWLAVGDSAVYWWPEDWDVLSWQGASTEQIEDYLGGLEAQLPRYEVIVLWLGTAELLHDYETAPLFEHMPHVVAQLAPHAQRLIVLGPMPISDTTRYWGVVALRDTHALVADTMAFYRQHSDVIVFDPSFIRRLPGGGYSETGSALFRDPIHLSDGGYAVLIASLARSVAPALATGVPTPAPKR